jgi:hypothetical protein
METTTIEAPAPTPATAQPNCCVVVSRRWNVKYRPAIIASESKTTIRARTIEGGQDYLFTKGKYDRPGAKLFLRGATGMDAREVWLDFDVQKCRVADIEQTESNERKRRFGAAETIVKKELERLTNPFTRGFVGSEEQVAAFETLAAVLSSLNNPPAA